MDESKIINKILDLDGRLNDIENSMLNKTDGEQLTATLDSIHRIVQRLDQERIFTTEWVKRIERDVEQQKLEIDKIKRVLDIA